MKKKEEIIVDGRVAFRPEFLKGNDTLRPTADIGRRPVEPLSLKPFYKLLAIGVSLLILGGLVRHYGL